SFCTQPRNPPCHTPCRRPPSLVSCPESVPASPERHRALPFRLPRTPRCSRSVRGGSPPADSRCNSVWLPSLCLSGPSSHPDPSSTHASDLTASPRGSPLSHCRDRPAEGRFSHPCVDNSSHSPTLPVTFHRP